MGRRGVQGGPECPNPLRGFWHTLPCRFSRLTRCPFSIVGGGPRITKISPRGMWTSRTRLSVVVERSLFSCSRPKRSVDSARCSVDFLPDFALLIGAKMAPSCTNLSLPEICLKSTRPILRVACNSSFPSGRYDFPFEPAKVNRWSPSTAVGSKNSRLHRLLTCLPLHAAERQQLRE